MGEQPVSSAASQHPSTISAFVTLNRVLREFQTRGWWFNRELSLVLQPQSDTGYVLIPPDTLDIDVTDAASVLVQRGTKLYDPVLHTYAIGVPVTVDVILQLPVEDLPEVAASYLIAKCKHAVYVDDDGDETKSNQLLKDTIMCWAGLQQAELKNSDISSMNRPVVSRLLSRSIQYNSIGNPNLIGGKY